MQDVEEIKSRLDIADAVQEYLPLKPAGSGSFKGLCPFHQEKTPSFYVNRPRQSWHCFGCDIGGDVISFVMRMEGMEFREALELLAQKTGVTLPQFDAQKSSEKKRLFEVNDLASRYFRAYLLNSPQAEEARAYVARRNIDDLTGDVWRIGYAPDDWETFIRAMYEKGATDDELVGAGLAAKRERGSGVYARFRGRVMFAICDVHGHVIGFTGRILTSDKKEAKYVNTPETALYKKSAVLYGLDKAKGEIKRRDLAVIVEGNMDVVSSHRAQVTNVVASSGTALTAEQLRLLQRFTRNLAIAFDQDAAGGAATLRGLDLARTMDFSIRIITLSPEAGKDPDEAVTKDVALWTDAISRATGIVEWVYRRAFRSHSPHTPEGKKLMARDILPEIARVADAVERDAWLTRLADDLGVSIEALREAFKVQPASTTVESRTLVTPHEPQPSTPKTRVEQLADRVLAILALYPDLRPLAESLVYGYPLAQELSSQLIDYLAILADREFVDQSRQALETELRRAATALGSDHRAQKRQRIENEMRDAERAGDIGRINSLIAQFTQLTQSSSSDSGGPRL